MNNFIELKASDHTHSEHDILQKGYLALDHQAIQKQIIGQHFFAEYQQGFKYVIAINADGSLEGKNNYDHYDTGHWLLKDNILCVEWDYGWDNACARFYQVNDIFLMFDAKTGLWRSTLKPAKHPVNNIKLMVF